MKIYIYKRGDDHQAFTSMKKLGLYSGIKYGALLYHFSEKKKIDFYIDDIEIHKRIPNPVRKKSWFGIKNKLSKKGGKS